MEKASFSCASRSPHTHTIRGNPQERGLEEIPHEAFQEAMGEVRDVMLQYTKCADPTEREARMERVRQAEERGQMEETAINMVRTSITPNVQSDDPHTLKDHTPDHVPTSQRLGSNIRAQAAQSGRSTAEHSTGSRERVPAPRRLGPPATLTVHPREDIIEALTDIDTERRPIALRLGPATNADAGNSVTQDANAGRRKPGRPPGPRKTTDKTPNATSKRKVAQSKPSPVRRRTTTTAGTSKTTKHSRGKKGETLHLDTLQEQQATASENVPLVNLIPRSTRRRMDFRIPSSPAP